VTDLLIRNVDEEAVRRIRRYDRSLSCIISTDDEADPGMSVAAAELLLEGLAAHRRISRADTGSYTRARPERKKPKPPVPRRSQASPPRLPESRPAA
jgi:hypothetical protein